MLFASEAYLSDVIVDVDSYAGNPWDIFGVEIDADTPSDDICENVSGKISFYNLSGHQDYDLGEWTVYGGI